MKEITFISKNEAKWKTLDSFVQGKLRLTPDELAAYYSDITADLSYAKTFYPKSNIVQYLNNLCSKAHQRIYLAKKEDRHRFFSFWTEEIPLAIRQSHRELLIALLIFLVAILIGSLSTYLDHDFSRLILGDGYVDMTINNITNGTPMAVYDGTEAGNMFFRISTNNVRVGLLSFALGIAGALFAGMILFTNGIMVGAFQSFFVKYGLLWTSFTAIFIHGALELSAIVIFGGAGIIMGNSWWYPGTYTRSESFMNAAGRSVKVVIAVLPVIIVAAILESYLTRHYQTLGEWGGMAIIIPSFLYIFWYFIYYPIRVERKLKAA